jgi:hypothetical protein
MNYELGTLKEGLQATSTISLRYEYFRYLNILQYFESTF